MQESVKAIDQPKDKIIKILSTIQCYARLITIILPKIMKLSKVILTYILLLIADLILCN